MSLDPITTGIFQHTAVDWRDARVGTSLAPAERFAAAFGNIPAAPVLAVGCDPWLLIPGLPGTVIGLDPVAEMLGLLAEHAPAALPVRAVADGLPFATESIAGALGTKVFVQVDRPHLPMALAELHRVVKVGGPIELQFFAGDQDLTPLEMDPLGGRRFTGWPADLLRSVVEGAGFDIEALTIREDDQVGVIDITARRALTLPDIIGPGMRLLICGLNPSVYSAETLVGFGRPGNRFWPAALAAGIATVDREPRHALNHHGMGMTDLVKRATPRADELTTDEYRAGLERVEQLCAWLRPEAVCFVGLAGWRAAADRTAKPGWQESDLGGSPVYVMPSTSGLNAHSSLADLTDHLFRAATGRR